MTEAEAATKKLNGKNLRQKSKRSKWKEKKSSREFNDDHPRSSDLHPRGLAGATSGTIFYLIQPASQLSAGIVLHYEHSKIEMEFNWFTKMKDDGCDCVMSIAHKFVRPHPKFILYGN